MITGFVGWQQGSGTWEERGFAADGKAPRAGQLSAASCHPRGQGPVLVPSGYSTGCSGDRDDPDPLSAALTHSCAKITSK